MSQGELYITTKLNEELMEQRNKKIINKKSNSSSLYPEKIRFANEKIFNYLNSFIETKF